MTRRRYWQLTHYWSLLRLRRKLVASSVVASVALCVAWLAIVPWTYRATAVVAVSGMCPHGIVIGEPYFTTSFGHTDISTTVCTQCRMKLTQVQGAAKE